jgi:3-hydroxyisobutyrate dehydrogenase
MGSAIAERLLAQNHRLTVWNRTPERTRPLIDAGAIRAATPAELVAGNDIVVTCLFDDAAITAVYDGPDGLLAADCAGKLFIDTSTVHAETLRAVAARVEAKGAALLECPVAGAPPMARDGRLMGFVGGREQDLARAQPLLDDLCQKVFLSGPLGSGNRMKLAVNLPLIIYFVALGEALSLVRDLPADPQQIIATLAESPGAANAMKIVAPLLRDAWISNREPAGFFPSRQCAKIFV